MRAHIVARPAVAAFMNDAAADDNRGDLFDVALAAPDAPTVPVAYWASWDFAATSVDPRRVQQSMRNRGATDAETTPVPPDADPRDVRRQRVAFFDAAAWTPDAVLDLLGLVRAEPDDGTAAPAADRGALQAGRRRQL